MMPDCVVNIFLPIQLCQSSGLLVGYCDGSGKNIVCSALLPLGDGYLDGGSGDTLHSSNSECLLGVLLREDDDVVPFGSIAVIPNFRIKLDTCGDLLEVVLLCDCPEQSKALVVFFDAVRVEETSSFHEEQHNPLIPLLLKNSANAWFITDFPNAIPAVARSHKTPIIWCVVIGIASFIKALETTLAEKLPQRVTGLAARCIRATQTGNLVCKRLSGIVAVKESVDRHGHITLGCKNQIFGMVTDCLLGVCLALVVHYKYDSSAGVPWASLEWTEAVVERLRGLLHWLMGVPAGLKLNAPLNDALGRFFLYHISLWETYVGVLQPWVGSLLCLWPGSITLHLALASDLLALATVHIYCFYGYACRLYQGWVRGLGALGRLFRGRKWNPLRQRVDSHRYDVDQMFVGTLLFTVLFFLFPTVAVYYGVFLGLRLAVLVVQGVLSRAVILWDFFPLYTLLASRLGNGPLVGDVQFEVLTGGRESALFMKVVPGDLQMLPDSLGGPPWKEFLTDIFVGNIVYPL